MNLLPRGLRSRDAEDYVGGATVLSELTRRWRLQPFMRQKGITVYDRHEIDAALDKQRAYRDTEDPIETVG